MLIKNKRVENIENIQKQQKPNANVGHLQIIMSGGLIRLWPTGQIYGVRPRAVPLYLEPKQWHLLLASFMLWRHRDVTGQW